MQRNILVGEMELDADNLLVCCPRATDKWIAIKNADGACTAHNKACRLYSNICSIFSHEKYLRRVQSS